MSEKQQLYWLVAGCFALALIGLIIVGPLIAGSERDRLADQDRDVDARVDAGSAFEGDLVIDQYDAVLEQDGALTEGYRYDVKNSGEYRMLYRIWGTPLTPGAASEPYVRFVSMQMPEGVVGYVKDNGGWVTTPLERDGSQTMDTIWDLAERNEIGIYKADYFDAGMYTVSSTYILFPLVEYDESHTRLTLKLAGDRHIPYRNVRITVPAEHIDKISVYPRPFTVTGQGSSYVITGSLAENTPLAIEMVGDRDAFLQMSAFRSPVDTVTGETEPAGAGTTPFASVVSAVNLLSMAAVLIIPLLLLWIYHRFGREMEYDVPASPGSIPNSKLKPWQVNLLFKKDTVSVDKDGLYATLLDLHRRNLIALIRNPDGTGFRIRLLRTTSPDPYEQGVLDFISNVSEGGVLDTARIETLVTAARQDSSSESTVLKYQRMLRDLTRRGDPALRTEYIVDGRGYLVPLLLGSIILFAAAVILAVLSLGQWALALPALLLSGIALVQTIVAMAMPPTFFGHWKEDRYREKLEWDAFARSLSDTSLVNRSSSDTTVWADRLVYGTALGVGHAVETVMGGPATGSSAPGIPPVGVTDMNAAFISLIQFTPPSRGGSDDGGDSSGGSGGGDGAGGR